MTTETPLKPCPFCGGEAKSPYERVYCRRVDCAGFHVAATVAQWNQRAATPPAPAAHTKAERGTENHSGAHGNQDVVEVAINALIENMKSQVEETGCWMTDKIDDLGCIGIDGAFNIKQLAQAVLQATDRYHTAIVRELETLKAAMVEQGRIEIHHDGKRYLCDGKSPAICLGEVAHRDKGDA